MSYSPPTDSQSGHYRDADDIERGYKHKEKKMEYGWLGVVFGAADNAPLYIAGSICLISLIFATIFGFCIAYGGTGRDNSQAWDFIKLLISVVTGCLGYLFGRTSRPE